MKKSILVTDKVHHNLLNALEADGYNVDYYPKFALEQTLSIIEDYFGVIVNSKTLCDKKLIDKGKKLKFIGRLGSGLEIIDLEYAQKKKIAVIRTPEGNCQSVGEHAIGMLLSLFNKLPKSRKQLKVLNWQREENRGIEIRGKKVGIIGYGHTGPAFKNLLSPFGAEVLIYDKYRYPYDDPQMLSNIKKEADIISLHLPMTEETRGYVDTSFIESMKKPFYLINTARGKNVITQDLLDGLDRGKVLGACLDVYENEKPNTYTAAEKVMYTDLMNRNNVICTPHVAGWTQESLERIADVMLEKIKLIAD